LENISELYGKQTLGNGTKRESTGTLSILVDVVTIYCLKRSCVGRRKLPVELGSSFGEPFFGLFWFKKDQFAVARIDAALQGAGGLVAGGRRRARNQRAVEGGATGRVSGYKRLGGEGSGLESPPRPFLRTPRGGVQPHAAKQATGRLPAW